MAVGDVEYITLGDSGLTVSRIGVGCGRFGRNDEAKNGDEAAAEFVDRAVERGLSAGDAEYLAEPCEARPVAGHR